mgnify:CR=1 FL=1
MCGIFGFVYKDKVKAVPIIMDGLKRLEYRGYDSSGIVVTEGSNLYWKKKSGRLFELEKKINYERSGNVAIGQTRWATHGTPVDKNAHPHFDCKKNIFLVHNGIIENYKELKAGLVKNGHDFSSDTDTEVLAHMIEDRVESGSTFEEAVRLTLKSVVGTYALAILNRNEPDKMIVAKNSSPLLIGFSDNAKFVASDASAILAHTRKVVYLNDGEFAVLTPQDFRIATLDRKAVSRRENKLDWNLESAQKNNFPHFMLKEIYEEPDAVRNALRGRLIVADGLAKLGGIESLESDLRKVKRLIVSACGTAYYAGLAGEYMIEEYGGVPVEVEYASELRYKKIDPGEGTCFLAVSQSGETADTLGVLKEFKRRGVNTLGIVNVVGSSIAREVSAGIYNYAGPEIGVASTKTFVSQLSVLALLTLFLGRQRGMPVSEGKKIAEELNRLPLKMENILKLDGQIKKLARKYHKYGNFIFLGRKFSYPVALEGALKLKEISYIHAEGYGAGEMKHGSIALIDKNMPVVVIAPSDSVYEKVFSNIQEIKARNGRVIAIATEGNKDIASVADDVIYIPKTLEMLTPILSSVPLHLFAYHVGVMRGHDVDKPRNLAKSVTVE